jgi:hypothetical protein
MVIKYIAEMCSMALDDEDFPSPSPATRMVVFPTATQGVAQAFAYPPNFGSNN